MIYNKETHRITEMSTINFDNIVLCVDNPLGIIRSLPITHETTLHLPLVNDDLPSIINYCIIKGINHSIIPNNNIKSLNEDSQKITMVVFDKNELDLEPTKGLTLAYTTQTPNKFKYVCGNCKSHIIGDVICKKKDCIVIPQRKKSHMKKVKSAECISFKSEQSDKDKKLQKTILIEANRRAYLERKEKFKRDMRNSSSNKVFDDPPKTKSVVKQCKATTKNGKPCSNKALKGSEYCGILSHKNLKIKNFKKKGVSLSAVGEMEF